MARTMMAKIKTAARNYGHPERTPSLPEVRGAVVAPASGGRDGDRRCLLDLMESAKKQ